MGRTALKTGGFSGRVTVRVNVLKFFLILLIIGSHFLDSGDECQNQAKQIPQRRCVSGKADHQHGDQYHHNCRQHHQMCDPTVGTLEVEAGGFRFSALGQWNG